MNNQTYLPPDVATLIGSYIQMKSDGVPFRIAFDYGRLQPNSDRPWTFDNEITGSTGRHFLNIPFSRHRQRSNSRQNQFFTWPEEDEYRAMLIAAANPWLSDVAPAGQAIRKILTKYRIMYENLERGVDEEYKAELRRAARRVISFMKTIYDARLMNALFGEGGNSLPIGGVQPVLSARPYLEQIGFRDPKKEEHVPKDEDEEPERRRLRTEQ